jgi:hypothetical protein
VSVIVVAGFLVCVLGLIFVLVLLPLGERTIRYERLVRAERDRLWQALWPLGRSAGWSGGLHSVQGFRGGATITVSRRWRRGAPVRRKIALDDVVQGRRFSLRVVDDSAFGTSFWAHYRETVELVPEGDSVRVGISRTDRYRGVVLFAVRHFATWRRLLRLKLWAESKHCRRPGWSQSLGKLGLSGLSALIF